MKLRLFLSAFLLLTLAPALTLLGQPVERVVAGVSLERLERYDQFLQQEVDAGRIPGAVALVTREGQVVHHAALGYHDMTDKSPMAMDDLFYIQSMTKPIITAAFMMLYEEGRFLLTDPVSRYLPAFKELKVAKDPEAGKDGETVPLKRAITIADLLTHTAGFSHGLGRTKLDREVFEQQYMQPHANIQSRVEALLQLPLIGQPGEQWYYSSAPDVLSVLIEQFSGMPTDEFLQKRIFRPLGMNDTGYNVPKDDQARVVPLHHLDDSGALVRTDFQPKMESNTIWSGVNALFSTPADYMKFCQMLLNGGEFNGQRLLSRKTVELMTLNHTGNLYQAPGYGYGYGFAVATDVAATNLLGSEGVFYWSGAYNTHFFIDPVEKIIAIFMTQTEPHDFFYHQKLRQFVYQAVVD